MPRSLPSRARYASGARLPASSRARRSVSSQAPPAGHATEIRLARGDKIRFLARNDDLGVINGTVATVTKVAERRSFVALSDSRIRLEVDVAGGRMVFDPMALADGKGRPRIGWAYASTIHGAQGLTVDHAVVYLDPSCNRRDAYVAASRARESTTLVVDAKGIDRRLGSELPIDRQHDDLTFPMEQRRVWLAECLSRASPKISTLDVIEGPQALQLRSKRVRDRGREFSHEH
jgi:UvrD-like helicase C-terminal domain